MYRPPRPTFEPVIGFARAASEYRAELICKPQALLRDGRRHRWATGDDVDESPQRVAVQEPIDELLEQAAVEERVDQHLGPVALDYLRDHGLQTWASEEVL